MRRLCGLLPCILYAIACAVAWRRVTKTIIAAPSREIIAETISGGFVCLTVPLSAYQILHHLSHFVEPRQQSQIVRIIWTVPVYSVSSWLSLRFAGHHSGDWSKSIMMVREIYEAYVIFSFMQYLVTYLDGDSDSLGVRLASKPAITGQHKPPFCCLPRWQMDGEFLRKCKIGVLQYVMMRVVTTVVGVALEHAGHGDDHTERRLRRASLCIQLMNAGSQTWALYVLFLFYHSMHKELEPIHPFGKFLCIKAIIFFSWWQAIALSFVVYQTTSDEIEPVGDDAWQHPRDRAQALQDLLVCMEMLLAAVAYIYVFPLSDFVPAHDLGSPRHESDKENDNPKATVAYAFWISCVPLELQDEIRAIVPAAPTVLFCVPAKKLIP